MYNTTALIDETITITEYKNRHSLKYFKELIAKDQYNSMIPGEKFSSKAFYCEDASFIKIKELKEAIKPFLNNGYFKGYFF